MGLLVGIAQLFSFAVVILYLIEGNDSNSIITIKVSKKCNNLSINKCQLLFISINFNEFYKIKFKKIILKMIRQNSANKLFSFISFIIIFYSFIFFL
jgi:hypothetical protein